MRPLRNTAPEGDWLVSHRTLIDRVVRSIARRKRLSDDEAEELSSIVRLRLLENGESIVGKFEGKSSLSTYLTTVVHRIFLDDRNQKWGKWRPSMAARRLGWVGEQLERLLVRDRIDFEQAAEILIRNHGVTSTVDQLGELAGRLPSRATPREECDDALEDMPQACDSEDRVRLSERRALARRVEVVLAEALRELPSEDSMILRMRFVAGHTVADISRALKLEQKPLYPRILKLQQHLRECLEAHGVSAAQANDLLEAPQPVLGDPFDLVPEPVDPRPSPRKGEQ